MRLIHTADWQVGKSFSRFGETADRLRSARLDAIEALGRLAVSNGAAHILVAGDIYDSDSPASVTLRQPIERMRAFPSVRWWLLPGNHDCHRPGGVWERVQAFGLPDNVHPLLSAEPVMLDPTVWLLPAPLTNRMETRDLTAAMERMPTPEGAIRVGLAHGSITSFASEGDAANPIDPDRATRAGLSYLGLGDWHRTQCINPRTWYAGTPEPDRFRSQEVGQALLVTLESAAAPTVVEESAVGTYTWGAEALTISDAHQLADAGARLQSERQPLSKLILRLEIAGVVPLGLRQQIFEWSDRLAASLCHLDCDLNGIRVRPEPAELDAIDFDGVLHTVAERLMARATDPALNETDRRIAEEALVSLYIEAHELREAAE